MFDRCDVLAPALLSGGVVRALTVGLSPANETQYHTPVVPWEATSQRFPVKVLIWPPFWYMWSPRRVIHRSEALPLRGFRGFLRLMPALLQQSV